MSQLGGALLSLWNDVVPERIAEYDRWHTIEHVPERVWVPGFVSGTRYVALREGQPRYFTLYELKDLGCLQGIAYQDLVEHPTAWSASMRPSLTGFVRKTGPVVASAGHSLGRSLALTRLVWPKGRATSHTAWQEVAQCLLDGDGPHWGSRVRIQQVQPAGPQALRNEDAAPEGDEFLMLLEHTRSSTALTAIVDLAVRVAGHADIWRWDGLYVFASQVRHEDVSAPVRPLAHTMPPVISLGASPRGP
jgi:hypothetical protein